MKDIIKVTGDKYVGNVSINGTGKEIGSALYMILKQIDKEKEGINIIYHVTSKFLNSR